MTATRTGDTVTLVTGDSRPVEKVFDGGAVQCPWCSAPWAATDETCPNPACMASCWADAEYVRETLARLAAETAARESRQRSREVAAEAAATARDAREARWDVMAASAERFGKCLVCLRASRWDAGRPRYVRHRRADYHSAGTA